MCLERIDYMYTSLHGRRPLVEASYAGQKKVVRFLVEIPGTDI